MVIAVQTEHRERESISKKLDLNHHNNHPTAIPTSQNQKQSVFLNSKSNSTRNSQFVNELKQGTHSRTTTEQ